MSSDPQSVQARSHRTTLLSLPLELRRKIYGFLVSPAVHSTLYITAPLDSCGDSQALEYAREPQTHLHLALLRANQQVYQEALPVLYDGFTFHPTADDGLVAAFFGQLSDFARSCVRRLELKPKPQRVCRVAGLQDNISQVLWAPSWAPVCVTMAALLPCLQEVKIHLNSWHGYELESGDDLTWLFAPLSMLVGVKKTLVQVANRSTNLATSKVAHRWDEVSSKTDKERGEYLASLARIQESESAWPGAYWRIKRINRRIRQKATTHDAAEAD